MGARVLAVAAGHARILARRRAALLLLALLPLAFYGALYRHSPHAITTAGVLSAFSAGGAGIFSMLPARAADQRLALAGVPAGRPDPRAAARPGTGRPRHLRGHLGRDDRRHPARPPR